MKWYYEALYPDIKIGLKGKPLYQRRTPFQDMKIFKNPRFGNVLVLDGAIQTTQNDEFIYHEMLSHPVLFAHPNPKKVLIIGAGDGGVLREALKHRVKEVVLVEIDRAVIDLSKKYLPSISNGSFKDKRVRVLIGDGAKFVAETKEKFDVIIVDSPDSVGPARVLFSKNFYKNIYSRLAKKGLMIRQSGSTVLQVGVLKENYHLLKRIFPYVSAQVVAIPTYIGGFFSFLIASKKVNPIRVPRKNVEARYKKLNLKTKYYNPQIHFASLALPNYIRRLAG